MDSYRSIPLTDTEVSLLIQAASAYTEISGATLESMVRYHQFLALLDYWQWVGRGQSDQADPDHVQEYRIPDAAMEYVREVLANVGGFPPEPWAAKALANLATLFDVPIHNLQGWGIQP